MQSPFSEASRLSLATARYRFRAAGAAIGCGGGMGVVARTRCADAASMNMLSTTQLRCLLVLLSLSVPVAAVLIAVGPSDGGNRNDPAIASPGTQFNGAGDNEVHWWPAATSIPEFFDESIDIPFKNSFE